MITWAFTSNMCNLILLRFTNRNDTWFFFYNDLPYVGISWKFPHECSLISTHLKLQLKKQMEGGGRQTGTLTFQLLNVFEREKPCLKTYCNG